MKTIINKKTGSRYLKEDMDRLCKKAGDRRTGEKKKKALCDKVEKTLRNVFTIIFIIFLATQAVLADEGMRGMLVKEALDGKPIGDEAVLFDKCRIELKLNGMPDCPELKVLVNGVEAGAFHENRVILELKEGDVVELDASRLLVQAEVQISAVSRNLEHLLGRTVTAANGIVPLAVANTG